MNRWTIPAALTLGASIAASCMVYGPDDLEGTAQSGGSSGFGGPGAGRGGGGTGIQGGQSGEPTLGGSPSGSGGVHTAGGGSGSGGRAGESFAGEGGDAGGTMAGGTGAAGAYAGTGGSGTGGSQVVDKTLLDNMEDGNNRIAVATDPPGVRRDGYWYTYATGTYVELIPLPNEVFTMPEHPEDAPGPGEEGNLRAFRLYAKQVADGGAAAGFNLLEPKGVYDASQYVGVSFWVRASKNLSFRLQIAINGTDASGGVCAPVEKCSDHYSVELDASTAWTKIDALWDSGEFFQEDWGTPVPFLSSELIAVQFFVPAAATNPEVELWIDDVAFIAPPAL